MQKAANSGLNAKPSTSSVGSSPLVAPLQLPSSTVEKNKQWQRELLMERIRSRASQQKSFTELSKSMRMSMLEKRYALDAVEKANLQKCLDSMQHCIKVTSRQGLVERLESLSRQLGLKFMEDTSGLFISTDMFYLEIMLDSNGALTDVKVHHECKIEQQSCSELVNCLNRGDFADFTVQLEGLSSIYQLNAEPKVKKKAFVALQAMETDLYNLYQIQQFNKDAQQLLESSAVGLVLKRRGGHPMRLTYFVAPYDLISLKDKSLQTLSLDLLSSKDIGMSVTVNLEAASANKLQIVPTVTFVKDSTTGIETPVYAPLTQLNSTLLPANFVLRLNKPLPVCSVTLRALLSSASSGGDSVTSAGTTSSGLDQKCSPTTSAKEIPSTIMNLIVQTASDQQLKNSSKGLFVCLPDQTHCYFFTENRQLKATLVSSVPFTEPSQVPIIIKFLKKHALFYALLSSCVRPQAKMGNDMDMTTILEVNAISFQQISVSLQHSFEESMATIDFNLAESSISCNIYALNRNYDLLSMKLTNIVQKSLSIPVTIRALLKFWDDERMKIFQRGLSSGAGGINVSNISSGSGNIGNPNIGPTQTNNIYGNFNLAMGPSDPGGGGNGNNVGASMKQEINIGVLQQRQFLPNPTNVGHFAGTAGVSGYFKSDHVKPEDFHESPKSETSQMQSLETSSLGQITNTQQQQQQTADFTTVATDLEIADKYKNIWKDKTTNLKNSVSITPIMQSVVGVVPTSENSIALNSSNLDIKRTGIEIIPLMNQSDVLISGSSSSSNNSITSVNIGNSSNAQQSAPSGSTITITPITNVTQQQIVNSKIDKKDSGSNASTISSSTSSKRNLIDTVSSGGNVDQKEKKRSKKKRDDSPMGPPEKVFSRQNSPATIATVNSESGNRKFTSPSSSPKSSGGGILSSSTIGTSSAISNPRPSPKHSPVYTSPKHQSTASNSPKSPFGTHSPKHGSSGKPSMSTLKSATASLSPKAEKQNPGNLIGVGLGVCGSLAISSSTTTSTNILGRTITNAGGGSLSTPAANSGFISTTNASSTPPNTICKSRDKDKMTANLITGGKVNVTSMPTNIQQMKATTALNHMPVVTNSGLAGVFNASVAVGSGMCNVSATNTNTLDSVLRKSVAPSAVSLMTSTAVSSAITTLATPPQHLMPPGSSDKLTNNEYCVKSSQEGLKLTINKNSNKFSSFPSPTEAKGNAKSSTNSAMEQLLSSTVSQSCAQMSGAKKLHTGLKPGVNSGPASSKKSPISLPSSHATSIANITATTLAITQTNLTGFGGGAAQTAKRPFQKSYSFDNLSTKSFNISSALTETVCSSITSGNSTSSSGSNNNCSLSNDSFRKSTKKAFEHERERCSASTTTVSHMPTRPDHHADMMRILQFASPTTAANMEGFMRNVSAKFQIPKLSQRSVVEHTQNASKALSEPATPTSVETSTVNFFGMTNFDRGSISETSRHLTATNFSNLQLKEQDLQQQQQQQYHQQVQQQQHQKQQQQQQQQYHQAHQQQKQQQQQYHQQAQQQQHQQQQQQQQQQQHRQQQQQQQQQQYHQQEQQHQQLLHQSQTTLMNVTRPPPPPYHAAIAAAAAAKTAGLAAPSGSTTTTPTPIRITTSTTITTAITTTTTIAPITTTPIPITATTTTTPTLTTSANHQQTQRNDVASTVEKAVFVNAYIVGK